MAADTVSFLARPSFCTFEPGPPQNEAFSHLSKDYLWFFEE